MGGDRATNSGQRPTDGRGARCTLKFEESAAHRCGGFGAPCARDLKTDKLLCFKIGFKIGRPENPFSMEHRLRDEMGRVLACLGLALPGEASALHVSNHRAPSQRLRGHGHGRCCSRRPAAPTGLPPPPACHRRHVQPPPHKGSHILPPHPAAVCSLPTAPPLPHRPPSTVPAATCTCWAAQAAAGTTPAEAAGARLQPSSPRDAPQALLQRRRVEVASVCLIAHSPADSQVWFPRQSSTCSYFSPPHQSHPGTTPVPPAVQSHPPSSPTLPRSCGGGPCAQLRQPSVVGSGAGTFTGNLNALLSARSPR